MIRKLLIVLLLLGLATPLSGCGRKGSLEPPPDSDFPRQYPTQ